MEKGEHAGGKSIINARPQERDVERNLAPAMRDVGDVDEGWMSGVIPRPGLDVQSRVRLGLSPETLEDEAEDLSR